MHNAKICSKDLVYAGLFSTIFHIGIQSISLWLTQCTSYLECWSGMRGDIDLASLQDALMEIDDEIRGKDEILNGTPVFTSEDLKLIRRVITQAKIPSWLNRPSKTFGDSSDGKVRLADWITLFTVFLPFAMVELRGSPQNELVDMWYHLAMLTELAVEYEVDESNIQCYLYHPTCYRSNLQECHPELAATPNQHMAYHLPKQLCSFGPANFLALWHFEQINGILQKVATNNKIKHKTFPFYLNMNNSQQHNQNILDDNQLSKLKTNFSIPVHLYKQVVTVFNQNYQKPRHEFFAKHKGNFKPFQKIVPTVAKIIHSFKQSGLTYTDFSNKGSSSITYNVGSEQRFFGTITQIFEMVLFEKCCTGERKHKKYTFVCVQRLEKLNPVDELKNPYPKVCPELQIQMFYSPPKMDYAQQLRFCDLIIPSQIIFHTATFQHNKETFGTQHHTVAVRSLGRSRSGQFQ
ncbi:uncharacterized protein VP01_3734g2 [Puccinia sorghi]|uniref:Uncharacterized protein n=1 Tax=Puccinia sorghi TaxID=27349 RepID=A0A0L6UTY1_9BASI|nr:uncharacterized protein VP01_3734g2 [Puccinia sorghi]